MEKHSGFFGNYIGFSGPTSKLKIKGTYKFHVTQASGVVTIFPATSGAGKKT